MIAIGDSVIVRIEKTHEDEMSHGKLTLELDPMFNPTNNVRIYGTVEGIGRDEKDLKVGDKVYFHYLVVDDSHIYDDLYNVDLSRIFCVVRDEKITMCRDWALFKPVEEKAKDVQVGNHKIAGTLTQSGLFKSATPKKSATRAKLCYIGQNDLMLQGGEVVYLLPKFEFENKIEGEVYYTCRQEYILGIDND